MTAAGYRLDRLASRNGGRRGLTLLAVILALGVGLRIGYAAGPHNSPVYDARAYAGIAEGLYTRGAFEQVPSHEQPRTQPSTNYSPGLPLLVGGIYELSGGVHLRLARLLLAVLASTAVLFAYLLARRWAGPTAGLIAAAPVAVYPALLEYGGMLMPEPLAASLLAATVLAYLWAADREGSPPRWIAPGLLLGATAMVRPEYLGVGILLAALALVWRGRQASWRAGIAAAAALLASLLIVILPWTVRNLVVLDRLVPISTGAGQVLFAGNYLPSGGDPQKVGAELLQRRPALRRALGDRTPYLERILILLARRTYPDLEPDAALARMGRRELGHDIADHGWEYLGFIAKKAGRVWWRGPREVMTQPQWAALHAAVVLLGLTGLVLLWRRRPWEAGLLSLLVAAATLTSVLLVASPRRTLILLPLVAALAGAGAVWLAGLVRERRAARAT